MSVKHLAGPGVTFAPRLSEGAAPSDYANLKRRVESAGLLEKNSAYYVRQIVLNLALLALCLSLLAVFRDPWLRALDAIFLGFVTGQIGFQVHNAGHRQMFAAGWKNFVVGIVSSDVVLGLCYSWWVNKHNRHHGNPNDVELDPDISPGAISLTREQAMATRGPMRLLTKYQAYLFFVLITGVGWSMQATGMQYLLTRRFRFRRLEVFLLVVHLVLYFGGLILWLGLWSAILVILVHKATVGAYMALVFAPNHKGMPQIDRNSNLDFLREQVLTARNIRAHRVWDYLYGGLNYQIEHHLFPTMPITNLREASVLVKEFCYEVGVDYYETGLIASFKELLMFLHEVGTPLRAPVPGMNSSSS